MAIMELICAGAYIFEGASLVAVAVGAAHTLALDAALLPLQALVVHQIPRLLVRAVVQHLYTHRQHSLLTFIADLLCSSYLEPSACHPLLRLIGKQLVL